MTISYNWLKAFLPINLAAEKVGEVLTDTGLEVEGIEKIDAVKGGLAGVVVGEVLTCEKHPNADRLRVTTVDLGEGEPVQIVCGAPNVAAGQKVPVATVGTTLYDGDDSFKIKKGKIRGEVSMGMICAEDELGLGSSHDGIMVLERDAKPGTKASDYFKLDTDYVFEIGLTPNRTDAMSHYGVARDLKAGLAQQGIHAELANPEFNLEIDNNDFVIPVVVENKEACPQYLGITISGVVVKESPEWMQKRLRAIGLKPINNVVDATNYVLHEYGHPLHAFDAAKITGGTVVVKNLEQNTPFITLDEVERKLDANDLMICNDQGGMCIAGVFGGVDSGVTESTTDVFLESAWFNPVSVRKTAKRHALNTDASYRYERGVDPNFTRSALIRAAMLIKEITDGKISSDIQEAVFAQFPMHAVQINLDRVNALIGNNLPAAKVEEILLSLEFVIENKQGVVWDLKVPTYRAEVTREADVIEEILRIYGFNNVELPEQMHFAIGTHDSFSPHRVKSSISQLLTGNGYYEIMNNSLTKRSYYETFMADDEKRLVNILNPLSQDLGVMRQSLIFGGLEVVRHNINRQLQTIRAFEFGKVYFKQNESEYFEEEQLMILLSGKDTEESWTVKQGDANFFQTKGLVNAVLERMGVKSIQEKIIQTDDFGETLIGSRGDKELYRIGQVADRYNQHFDVAQPVFVALLKWEALLKIAARNKTKFQELPRFPWVRRDLALLVDTHTEFESMRIAAQKAGGKLIKEINLFDVYTGKNLPSGKKSYAISFKLQDFNQTLVDKKVEAVMTKVTNALAKQFGAELR